MMKIKIWELIVLALISVVGWFAFAFMFGFPRFGLSIILAVTLFGFSVALLIAARKLQYKVWAYAGLFTLVVLFFSSPALARLFPLRWLQPFETGVSIMLLLIYTIALLIAALLAHWGLVLYKQWQNIDGVEGADTQTARKQAGRTAIVVFVLSALLVAKVLYSFYWFMLWDTTYDSLNFLWFIFLAPGVLYSIALLFIILPSKAKQLGFGYLLVIPALIVVAIFAQRVDFRQLTEVRAARVSQAVEAYYNRNGHYPKNLGQLTPWYSLTLPGPVTLYYGQDWCYNGGADYYRLGYVTREHWSDPRLIGKTYQASGTMPELGGMCEAEIAAFIARYPDSMYQYWAQGE